MFCVPAPVLKPAVSQMCFSPEQMNITCSSGGDEVEFSLTLNSHLLMQSKKKWPNMQLLASSETDDKSSIDFTISLNGQLTGHLTCSVWNDVSRDETVIHLTGCKGTVLKGCFLLCSKYNHFTNCSHFLPQKFRFRLKV